MTPDPGGLPIVTLTHPVRDVLFGSAPHEEAHAIAQQIRDQNLSALLPEQEWCEDCARDVDAAAEPGMPQDIVDRSIEQLTLPPGLGSRLGTRAAVRRRVPGLRTHPRPSGFLSKRETQVVMLLQVS